AAPNPGNAPAPGQPPMLGLQKEDVMELLIPLLFPHPPPAFRPTYHPAHIETGVSTGAGGGALTAISAANADPLAARMKAAPDRIERARLLIGNPHQTIIARKMAIRGYP